MAEGAAIETVLEAYRAAVQDKDVETLIALYDEDVRVFDLWGAWSYDGADAWRRAVNDWFGSLGDERVGVELDDVATVVGDDVAAVHAFISFTGMSADGEELRSMTNRLSWALAKRGDTWKIVHEHTSGPADFETAKVRLRR